MFKKIRNVFFSKMSQDQIVSLTPYKKRWKFSNNLGNEIKFNSYKLQLIIKKLNKELYNEKE